MHISPHLSPSPLGDLVLAWLKLGRGVSFFSFLFSLFFAFLGCMGARGWAEGFLRGWAGSAACGLVVCVWDWVLGWGGVLLLVSN